MRYISAKDGSRQPVFLITTGILMLLSTAAVSLRLFCRIVYVNHVGLDDYFILAALAVAAILTIMNIIQISWGTGQHLCNLDLVTVLVPTLKHWYAYQMVYPWALFFVKASILALYHRVYTETNFRRFVYLVAGFVTVYTIVVFFINAFECRSNVSQSWSPTFPEKCNNLPATYISTASIDILSDVVIWVMPLRVFLQLHMNSRKRWALLCVFMIGGIAVIASVVRLYALWVYTTAQDILYDGIFILLFSQIEVNIAIVSASVPALRPLFNKALSSNSSIGNGNSDYSSHRYTRKRAKPSTRSALLSRTQNGNRGNDDTASGANEEYILQRDGILRTVHVSVNIA